EGAVAEEHPVGEDAVGPADLDEIERLLVELGHRLRVFGGDRDVAELGHGDLLRYGLALSLSRERGQAEASHRPSRAIRARISAMFLPTRASAASRANTPKRSNSGKTAPSRAVNSEAQRSVF